MDSPWSETNKRRNASVVRRVDGRPLGAPLLDATNFPGCAEIHRIAGRSNRKVRGYVSGYASEEGGYRPLSDAFFFKVYARARMSARRLSSRFRPRLVGLDDSTKPEPV